MDDAALVRQTLAGQPDAYARLVERWAGRVLALCHARIGRADVAEELAQEALVRGLEQLPSLAEPTRFGPWLIAIAANTCRDWLKARQNSQVPFSTLAAGGPQPPASAGDDPEQREEADRLLREMEALPEELRVVLMMFYYDGSTYRDIAHALDVSTATVNARLTRARALLRQRLGEPS